MQAIGVPADRTWMIGDSMADVEAARAAGVRSALLFADNRCELCPLRSGPPLLPHVHAAKLPELAGAILASDLT